MRKELVSKEDLLGYIEQYKTIFKVAEAAGCCENTIRNYMKKYDIEIPSGFFSKGKKLGRKSGFKHTEQWKKNQSKRMMGSKNPFYDKKHTKATKDQMSKNHADFTGDNNPFRKACQKDSSLVEFSRQKQINFWSKLDKDARYKIMKKCVIGDLSKGHWSNIINNAKSRNLPVMITPKDVWEIWLSQNGKCALTGIDLNLKSCDEITASLDRIDSNQGYILSNVWWIHKDLNMMKNRMSMTEFIKWCELIVRNNNEAKRTV